MKPGRDKQPLNTEHGEQSFDLPRNIWSKLVHLCLSLIGKSIQIRQNIENKRDIRIFIKIISQKHFLKVIKFGMLGQGTSGKHIQYQIIWYFVIRGHFYHQAIFPDIILSSIFHYWALSVVAKLITSNVYKIVFAKLSSIWQF